MAELNAQILLREADWFTDRKAASYSGLEMYDAYAPLPVFFEGHGSSPRSEITEYRWDFGDGSGYEYGFNAVHVYESAGVYTVTLRVARATSVGETPEYDTDTATITVNTPDGTTYYVDSALGNDGNAGTGTGASAWQTATKAFGEMANGTYGPGDRILFNRGQTFDMDDDSCVIPHWGGGYGYSFGAYGIGDKPIIQSIGDGGEFFSCSGVGLAMVGFVDLEFNLTAGGNDPCVLWNGVGGGQSLLWLRCDVKNMDQGWVTTASLTGNGVASGFFYIECTTNISEVTHMFFKGYRLGVHSCEFDDSDNHIIYGGEIFSAVVYESTFTKTAFGRCALRVAGGDSDNIASNILVYGNTFTGWQDPNPGGRWNYLLVNFGPNADAEKFGEYLHFENNTITDCETLMNIGGWEHCVIKGNTFETEDSSVANKFHIGHSLGWDHRPNYDVQIVENKFIYDGSTSDVSALVALHEYTGAEYDGRTAQELIVFKRNIFKTSDIDTKLFSIPEDADQYAGLDSEYNFIYYADEDGELFEQRTSPVTHMTLADWKTLTGGDQSTQVCEDDNKPTPGWVSVDATNEGNPIKITFKRAEITQAGASLGEVELWVKTPGGTWERTGVKYP